MTICPKGLTQKALKWTHICITLAEMCVVWVLLCRREVGVVLVVLLGWGWRVSLGTGPGWGEGRKQNTTSLCPSALKDSPSCDNCTKLQNTIRIERRFLTCTFYFRFLDWKRSNQLPKPEPYSFSCSLHWEHQSIKRIASGFISICLQHKQNLLFLWPPSMHHPTALSGLLKMRWESVILKIILESN